MQDYQEAMVKSLVAIAWADGRVDAGESEVIEALISAFELAAHIGTIPYQLLCLFGLRLPRRFVRSAAP